MAIVVPRVGEAIAGGSQDLSRVRGYVRDRLARRTVEVPDIVVAEVPVISGGDAVGAALLLDAPGTEAPPRVLDVLNVVASRSSPSLPWPTSARRRSRPCAAR